MKRIALFFLVLFWAVSAFALSANDLSKNINSQIRQAEKVYFKGKAAEAAVILEEVKSSLSELKTLAGGEKKFKSLNTKYGRLKTRVDKKLGKTSAIATGSGSKPAAAGAKSSAKAKNLSYGAKSNLKKASREMDSADQEIAKAEKSLKDKQFNLVDSYVFNADSKLKQVGTLLDKVVNNSKADPTHPEVAAAFARQETLRKKLEALQNRASGTEEADAQAENRARENAAELNRKWLPRIKPFIEVSSKSRVQFPGSHDPQALSHQEGLYADAQNVYAEVNREVPASAQPQELKNAVEKLGFTLKVYADEKKADRGNKLAAIENNLTFWEMRFQKNNSWNENSNQSLFVIPEKKIVFQKKVIADANQAFPDQAKAFTKRLNALETENRKWQEKKRRWQERPRPFPGAGMVNAALAGDMTKLLKDSGIKVEKLVIVDKDWWVQQGEFRYLAAALLSSDGKGEYWSNVRFRQIKTLAGYGPTEIWEIDKIRIRLP